LRCLVFLLAMFVLVAGVVACGGDEPTAVPPPLASPTPEPAATATACPVDPGTCAFAALISQSLATGAYDEIVNRLQLESFTCPGQPPMLGGPFPLCDGAPAGEVRPGTTVGFLSSEGAVMAPEEYREILDRWTTTPVQPTSDQFGVPSSRLYSVGCPAGAPPCRDRYVLVFSKLQLDIQFRLQLLLYVEQRAGRQFITFTAAGPLLVPGQLDAALRGGTSNGFLTPQGWTQPITFYPFSVP
jgi:hypothetical protein